MRIVGDILHPKYQISILQMNQYYTIQIKNDYVTQSYKIHKDASNNSLDDFAELLKNKQFMQSVDQRFVDMQNDLSKLLKSTHVESEDDAWEEII